MERSKLSCFANLLSLFTVLSKFDNSNSGIIFFFYLAEKCFIICKKVCTIRSLLKQYFNIKLENIIDFGSVVNRRTSVIRAQFSWFYTPVHRS